MPRKPVKGNNEETKKETPQSNAKQRKFKFLREGFFSEYFRVSFEKKNTPLNKIPPEATHAISIKRRLWIRTFTPGIELLHLSGSVPRSVSRSNVHLLRRCSL